MTADDLDLIDADTAIGRTGATGDQPAQENIAG
jgi:hypothetical protein